MNENISTPGSPRRTTWAWLLLAAATVAAVAAVVIPVFILRPFSPQSPGGLEAAYLLRRWSPVVAILGLAIALGATAIVFARSRLWLPKIAALPLVALAGLAAWLSFQNHFEWMFRQPERVAFAAAKEAGFVADADMIMSVALNGDAAAYPVRQMAYHHIAHDTVGGVPIVVTY